MPKTEIIKSTGLEQSDYGARMVKSLHECMKLVEFTADDLWYRAKANGVPESEIARLSGAILKRYQSSGFYIRKSKRFRLSTRTSAPLPIWVTAKKLRKPKENV